MAITQGGRALQIGARQSARVNPAATCRSLRVSLIALQAQISTWGLEATCHARLRPGRCRRRGGGLVPRVDRSRSGRQGPILKSVRHAGPRGYVTHPLVVRSRATPSNNTGAFLQFTASSRTKVLDRRDARMLTEGSERVTANTTNRSVRGREPDIMSLPELRKRVRSGAAARTDLASPGIGRGER